MNLTINNTLVTGIDSSTKLKVLLNWGQNDFDFLDAIEAGMRELEQKRVRIENNEEGSVERQIDLLDSSSSSDSDFDVYATSSQLLNGRKRKHDPGLFFSNMYFIAICIIFYWILHILYTFIVIFIISFIFKFRKWTFYHAKGGLCI